MRRFGSSEDRTSGLPNSRLGYHRPIQRDAASFGHARESLQKSRIGFRSLVERISSFSRFFDRNPVNVRARSVLERGLPDLAVPFVQEVVHVEADARQIMHVMRERSHAHHDDAPVVVRPQILSHRPSSDAVLCVTL